MNRTLAPDASELRFESGKRYRRSCLIKLVDSCITETVGLLETFAFRAIFLLEEILEATGTTFEFRPAFFRTFSVGGF